MKFGLASDDQVYRVLGQQLSSVITERIRIGNVEVLVDYCGGRFGCMHRWELDVSVRLVFRASDGQRGIEGI